MKIYPIKKESEFIALKKYFFSKPIRDQILYALPIMTGLQVRDLIKMTVEDIDNIIEDANYRKLIKDNIDDLAGPNHSQGHTVFNTIRGNNPLKVRDFSRTLVTACDTVCTAYSYSCESLRKTYYYNLYITGTDLRTLCELLKHPSTTRTRQYLCISNDDQIKHLQAISEKER